MSTGSRSRREFLLNSAAGLSAAWVTANYAGILEAAAYAQQGPAGGQSASFAFFRPEQAAEGAGRIQRSGHIRHGEGLQR